MFATLSHHESPGGFCKSGIVLAIAAIATACSSGLGIAMLRIDAK